MKTWIILDKSLLEAQPNNVYKCKRYVVMVGFLMIVCLLAMAATTRFVFVRISSTKAKDSTATGSASKIPRDMQFRPGSRSVLSDEKYQGTKKLPRALLIGAKKAGTRALLEFIRVHPNVRAAGHEIHYFDRNYSYGPEWYRNMMPTSIHGQITIEKTPSYMVTTQAPRRVYEMNSEMKIIVVLKDPVERAVSDFTQSRTKHRLKRSFETSVLLDLDTLQVNTTKPSINNGMYSQHVKRWLQYFPRKQFCFINGENLVTNPASELKKLQHFLGLNTVITEEHFYFNSTKGFPCLKKREASGVPHCLGEGKGRVHPTVSPYAKVALYDFYRPYNFELYKMTGIDFKWEKRKPILPAQWS